MTSNVILKNLPVLLLAACYPTVATSQNLIRYNLRDLLKKSQFEYYSEKQIAPSPDSVKKLAVQSVGLVLLKGSTFSQGTIEIDLRGRDVLQQSFLGIAFHVQDTSNFDVVYFRPFNFQNKDTARRQHAVQYMSLPNYPWDRLRTQFPMVYEHPVTGAPSGNDWFHAKIVIGTDSVWVFFNRNSQPVLQVKMLSERKTGKIGLWGEGLKGDYADLVISE